MIALLGPPPYELSVREENWSTVEWKRAFPDNQGKFCWTARECYGGPFFNAEGAIISSPSVNISMAILTMRIGVFLYENLVPRDVSLSSRVLSLDGRDKILFLDFVSHMLEWLPEKRRTAKELLEHPWLTGISG